MKGIATLVIIALACYGAAAQDAEQEVTDVVIGIFDGMREADTTKIASHFMPGATMKSVFYTKEGESVIRDGSLEGWMNGIMANRETLLDERLWDIEVRVDGNLAQLWTYYALYVGGEYHHCGVDAFQLFFDGTAWKIFHIADTRRMDCDIPDEVKNQ